MKRRTNAAVLALLLAFPVNAAGLPDSISAANKPPTGGERAVAPGIDGAMPSNSGKEAAFAQRNQVEPGGSASVADRGVDPIRLSRSLDDILQRREYTWRMPRTKAPADEASGIAAFIQASVRVFKNLARPVVRIARKVYRWFLDKFKPRDDESARSGLLGNLNWARALPYVLGAIVAAAAALLAYRYWRRRRPGRSPEVASQPVSPILDLASEQVLADQLPEDRWAELAREMAARGELRLALRAWYLASLSHLAQREMIRLARHKSNHDYHRELRRRARSRGELVAAFNDNLNILERVWYGMHEVTDAAMETFAQNLERIRTG